MSQWNADKSAPQSGMGTSPVSGIGLMTVALYIHSSRAVWCQHQQRGLGGVDFLGYVGSCAENYYVVLGLRLCHLEAITLVNY